MVTSQEIQKTLWEIREDIPLRIVTYASRFYKKSQHLEDYLVQAIKDLFIIGKILKEVNYAPMILVRKVK